MKILCVIDTLNSGGAQKQLVYLACGLKQNGHDVEVFAYFPQSKHFLPQLMQLDIPVHFADKHQLGAWGVNWALLKLIWKKRFDTALSFLAGANALTCLASVFSPYKMRVVVGERSSFRNQDRTYKATMLRFLYIFADDIVANSHVQQNWLSQRWWVPARKTHAVYNGYPLDPQAATRTLGFAEPSHCSLLVVARVTENKNALNLIHAMRLFHYRHGFLPQLRWAGRQENDPPSLAYRSRVDALLKDNPQVARAWHWLGESNDVPRLLAECDALVLPSFFEGLPNAVCEAFVAGRPVLASNVCDHPVLVEDGVRGLLCDPHSPISICLAMEKIVMMSPQDREEMGQRARQYAEQNLTLERMVKGYEAILDKSGSADAKDTRCAG